MSIITAICVFLPFISAIIAYFAGKKRPALLNAISIGTCFIVFAAIVSSLFIHGSHGEALNVLSLSFSISGFQSVYGIVTAFMWFGAALLSVEYFKGHHDLTRYFFFFLVTLGATMGVFLSADLITTFIFFEIIIYSRWCSIYYS